MNLRTLAAVASRLETLPIVGQARRLSKARFLATPGTRYMDTPHGAVRVREQPSSVGPRLLLGVDGPNVIEHYDALLRALSGKADVVVIEPPGTGGSAPARGFDFRLTSFADLTAHVLAEIGPRTLVFPCYLGLVAEVVARRSPALAPRVVLPQTASAADFLRWADRVDKRRLLRTPFLGQALVSARRRVLARSWYRASVGHRECEGPFAKIADDALVAGGSFCLASLMQALARNSDAAPKSRGPLSVPAAVPWGDKDRSHSRSDPTRTLPGAEVVRVAECGHSPELEEPARFAAWLLSWEEKTR